jgi:predicted Zn-dependent peptidase
LDNGLRLIVHPDDSTPMVAINVLYQVGSRDESPDRTGFAHLFEHLMFGGSVNIPDFDGPIQLAGGENNAFTNTDITNFYDILPAENLEVGLWLESDRMLSLLFSKKSLSVQRKVVVEEFKETCINEPYGDVWHHISDLAYRVHPYRWPTIGLVPEHVEKARLKDVEDFFYRYYRPNNAVLVIAGKVDPEEVHHLVRKWFGDIPAGVVPEKQLPVEPAQAGFVSREVQAKVPLDSLYLVFHTCGRMHPDFYALDLLSDVLGNGQSSRLYRRLLKERKLFSHIDCYITGTVDPGLLILEGRPSKGVAMDAAEAALWEELTELTRTPVSETELEKLVNKSESTLEFSEASVLNKAMNLAFFEMLGDAGLINAEGEKYRAVTSEDILRVAQEIFRRENCSRLLYLSAEPSDIGFPEDEEEDE